MTQKALIKDVAAYILYKMPKILMSNARLTKMVYLADWHQAIHHGRTITDINWKFDSFGPFVQDVKDVVRSEHKIFNVEEFDTGKFSDPKRYFVSLLDQDYNHPSLSSDHKKSLTHIIKVTKDLNWEDFIKLIYSTYPIIKSDRYQDLDLVNLAAEYSKSSIQ